MRPEDVLRTLEEKGVEFVDLRFADLPGLWQHLTIPAERLTSASFTKGFAFDGYPLRGGPITDAANIVLLPEPRSAIIDPFCQHTTLAMICDIQDATTGQPHQRDPRCIARKTGDYLRATGIADTAQLAPLIEFFVFDHVRYDESWNFAHYAVDSREGVWRRGRSEPDNLGNQLRPGEGQSPCPPADTLHNLRTEMALVLDECGVKVETHQHEPASGGQTGISLRADGLVEMADKLTLCKYVIRNVAARHGKTATFMPKPLSHDHGSGMPTHFALSKAGTPLFDGGNDAGPSDVGRWAIGGLIGHAGGVLAFTNPTTNSYKRLAPGRATPVNLVYSPDDRSAFIRTWARRGDPATKQIELCFPDPSGNPYLVFSAIVMAALDGIQNKVDPGPPIDRSLSVLTPQEHRKIDRTPASLEEALGALERDHEFLLRGDVFVEDVVRDWIEHKTANEVGGLRVRPHPYEFCLYYDV